LTCVAACCSVLQCVAVCLRYDSTHSCDINIVQCIDIHVHTHTHTHMRVCICPYTYIYIYIQIYIYIHICTDRRYRTLYKVAKTRRML